MASLRPWVFPYCVAMIVVAVISLSWSAATPALAAEAPESDTAEKPAAKATDTTQAKAEAADDKDEEEATEKDSSEAKAKGKKSKYPPYSEFLKEAETIPGLIKLHRKGGSVYAEISPSQMNKDFIVVISIARGIGRGVLLGGMSWGFGDDWIWQFRKVDDYVHVVRRNIRFTAAKGSPEERAVRLAFTDSILFSLPIATQSPSGGIVVDLNQVFMSDLPRISQELTGFIFSPPRSTWASVKGFADNVELEVAATYSSSGTTEIDNIPDIRGATVNIHYSISYLPQNGYKPRLADDRVGYFLTVLKDYSKKGDEEQFVRYINRWDLQKADPSADVSPPEKPIVFWLEKTIPYKYRAAIRQGILEWNKAFEKAGFVNAIEVRQQPDNAEWDPEDVNYNTYRWITTNTDLAFAMGPSRVNPTTGQIIDADILFDADFLQAWKTHYETFTPASVAAITGGPYIVGDHEAHARADHRESGFCPACQLAHTRSMDLALGGTALLAAAEGPTSEAERERLIMQGLKEVTMHEVGHTLGLRHNFKASTFLSLADINNVEKTRETGLTASVMDYAPVNIAPKGTKQGDYYSTTIGPYDMWAIEYGYKPFSGSPDSDKKELDKIAARSGEAGLQFATDEDVRGARDGFTIDGDPLVNQFDLGKEPLEYAKQRAELIASLWPTVTDRVVNEGDGYERARQAFGMLLRHYGRAMHFVARYVGGVHANRSHKGDPDAAPPFEIVDAKKQREALDMLEQQVFSDKPFQFPPKLYNQLAASRWSHWGTDVPLRSDYPAHEVILEWQDNVLEQLLSSLTLKRLHDSELKIDPDEDAFTSAELINRLTKAIFKETESLEPGEYTNRKPAISSLRRNLQRAYLTRMSKLAMGNTSAPEDCQTIAYAELKSLRGKMDQLLASNIKLDDYSRAHLTESSARIGKVLDAQLELKTP